MKLQDQLCTLEQAKRLLELGIWVKSYFLFLSTHGEVEHIGPTYWYNDDSRDKCPAFTVAELGVMLPAGYDTMYCTGEGWRGYDMDGNDIFEPLPTEAQTRAAMLIHVLETGEATADEVNKRLTA